MDVHVDFDADIDVAIDGAVDINATVVVDLDVRGWLSSRTFPRRTLVNVSDKGGAHVHGAVNDHVCGSHVLSDERVHGTCGTSVPVRFLRQAGLMLWKDLVVELRARDVLVAMTFFGVMVVLVFSLAFVRDGKPIGDVSGGILWVALTFSGSLGLSRSFEREREGDTLHGLLLAPVDRGAILIGKAVGITVFMALSCAVVVPLIAVLFGAPLGRHPLPLALLLVLGSFGFAIVGSIFGTLLLKSRARDVLLAVIIYPLTVPALIGGTVGSAALLDTRPDLDRAWFWIKALTAFDLIFLVVALWAFDALTTE